MGAISLVSLVHIIQAPRSRFPQGQAVADKLLPAFHPGLEAVPRGRADGKR